LTSLLEDREQREKAGEELRHNLADLPGIELIRTKPGCRTSAFFLTFTMSEQGTRDRLVTALQRRGLPLVWAWNTVPAFYRCFAETFPYGVSGSVYLADHVCHIPLAEYVAPARRRRLIARLRKELARG
jgi:dTDP-4-amino-4,6-dideoxygalactose transaminase